MIFIDKMKNFKIYRTKTFLPTVPGDKKKGSAILLMTPNYESSRKLMNNDMFVNSKRFESYYIERDVSYYINSKVVEDVEESALMFNQLEIADCIHEAKRSNLNDNQFGVPSKRKFPLDTEAHVRSAVKFFNYVEPEDEEELARRIIVALKKYNITDINVSDKNRFSKYYYAKNESAVAIPKCHRLYGMLDLYYSQWKNGTLTEKDARQKIYDLRGRNLANSEGDSVDTIPTPDEYYASKGQLVESLTESTLELTREDTMDTNLFLSKFNESMGINLGDKVMFLNEASSNDIQMKRLLYRSRLRYRKDVLVLLDTVKKDNPFIKFAFPEMAKYIRRNVFVDLYFYNAVFFENNTWVLKRGMNLYLDLMKRLLNHPNLKANGYSKKTIFIPVLDWNNVSGGVVWNFRQSLNPISCIYQLMFEGALPKLKESFGDTEVIFVGSNNYFKINFSQIDIKDLRKYAVKFRIFVTKMCNNEEFDAEDIDSSADIKEDPEVISTKIADRIENSKGIDLTPNLVKARIDMAKVSSINNSIIAGKPNEDAKELKKKVLNKMVGTASTDNLTSQAPDNKKKIKDQTAAIANLADKVDTLKLKEDEPDEDEARRIADANKLSNAVIRASETSADEEEALDALDDDEIKRILSDYGEDKDVDISASRAARLSELDKKLMDKQVNGRSIRDILDDSKSESKDIKTDVNVASPNSDEWTGLSYMNFDKAYDIDKDIVNIFKFFNTCTRPIAIREIKATDTSTSEDRISTYDVDMEDYRGKRFKIRLDIPIMEDNRFLLRGSYKSIQTQFFNMPIIKTELGVCQLISNYNKIFLYRFNDKAGKTLPAVSKLIKASKKYTGRKIKFEFGDNTKVCSKYNLPIDYIDLAGVFTKIETDSWIVYFNQDDIRAKYTVEPNKGFPFAYNKKLNAVEYFPPEVVDSFINMLCINIFKEAPEFEEIFDAQTRPNVCAYARASILNEKIPLSLVCAYYIGLRPLMDRAGIKYELVDKLTREIKRDVNKDWIEFNDGYVVYDINYESGMLMNGLKVCSTDMYSISDIDNKSMYIEFLDNYGGRIKSNGLDNFYDLFVDPMIKESLEYYHLPTDFIDILLYGNAMLNDNKFVKHTDTSSRRLRRYQLIAVYTYKVMADAYVIYANQLRHSVKNPIFSVKQSAVIDAFLTDTISSDDSCINALRDIETTNAITTKGPSGMNEDRSYTLDKRAYNDSMLNVLGMSTGFAGNVGITRQATINSNVTGDGYVKSGDGTTDNMNDANTLTATESLIPFGSTHDDPMRTAMSFIQTSKHMVRTEDSDPLLVTSGADEVMPYLTTDKFAYKAKKNGIVLEATDQYILVQYDDGSKDYINLKETIEKNSDGGYFVPLKLDAADGIKVGKKFKKDTILAYDKYSFSNKLGESNNLAYNIGKLAKVAILNTDEGFEDSGIISDSMAKKLATRVILKFDVVVNKDARVYSIAKVGDHIEASDVLIMWEDAFEDEDAEELMGALADSDISDIGKRKLKSEVTGKLAGIKMFRTVELDDMSPSLKKIVSDYEKPIKAEAKIIEDNGLSKSKVAAHYVLPPNGKLKKSQDAVLIEFYVEYLDSVGVGDKIVYNSANKAVEKGIIPEGLEPYTEFRPNEKLDALLASTSIDKRLVTSTYLYGSLQKLMIELDRSVKDIMGIEYDDSQV